ncbi:hypothetical protein JTB14_022785 [Gonioctena quinquepunctata]|nr:hypothetical protein JTB14_022785 [Gonioctena quinquepunctata]
MKHGTYAKVANTAMTKTVEKTPEVTGISFNNKRQNSCNENLGSNRFRPVIGCNSGNIVKTVPKKGICTFTVLAQKLHPTISLLFWKSPPRWTSNGKISIEMKIYLSIKYHLPSIRSPKCTTPKYSQQGRLSEDLDSRKIFKPRRDGPQNSNNDLQNNVSVLHINIQCISDEIDHLALYPEDGRYTILCLSEHWLN